MAINFARVPLDNLPPDPAVVKVMEEWLEMAKNGEIRGVFICGLLTGRKYAHAWQGNWSLTESLGCVEMAKHRAMMDNLE